MAARVGALKGWRQLLLGLVAGAALGLVQAPWSFPLAFFVALPVIFWLHTGAAAQRRAAAVGWFAGFGYFGLTLVWIVEPFLVDIARHGWMAPFAIFFMAAGLAAFWAAAFWLAPRGKVFALVVLWSTVELARAYVFTGFPWVLLGQGWLETPLIQVVYYIGVHGLGLLTLTGIALLSKLRVRQMLIGSAIFAALWGFGTYRLSQPVIPRTDGFVVRIIQPNVDQKLKWLPEFQAEFFQRQLDLSALDGRHDIVIWPEASVPFLIEERPDLLRVMASSVGSEIIFGARRHDDVGNWYNTLVLLYDGGTRTEVYDKQHLVPFGEYVPFQRILQLTKVSALTGRGWTAGDVSPILSVGETPSFLPLICYEAIFPSLASEVSVPVDWIVQITNDAWFGEFSGPYQHLAQARVRAIEQGKPLARSANTGISALIDPYGRIIDSIPLGRMGVIDVALPAQLPRSFYGRTLDWPITGILLLLTILQLLPVKRRRP
ncbi:apolipoprotein N-acyltransferase [Rhodobacterales bacterium 52_120_T64]|nr:apolipoprotein N-acyltransferase [Rhodobacterales bacterium 52_120_T64]